MKALIQAALPKEVPPFRFLLCLILFAAVVSANVSFFVMVMIASCIGVILKLAVEIRDNCHICASLDTAEMLDVFLLESVLCS